MTDGIFPRIYSKGFDLAFSYHADAILSQHFERAIDELDGILGNISIPIVELVRGGGGEALMTQRLRKALNGLGWTKQVFKVEKKINDKTTFSQSHEVDHVKDFDNGTIALEIEWNNKDPFFDRDLENFSRLHADGGISVGIIVTRGRSIQDGVEERLRDFALARDFRSFSDLAQFGIEPTRRQADTVEKFIRQHGCTFPEAWAVNFFRDKFGTATTHWTKLKARLDRGVGSPCPIVAFGIPLSCIVD